MKALFSTLTKDGAVLYGLASPIIAARAGITSKNRIWIQTGETALVLPKLDDWREDGCGIRAKGSAGENLYLVAPADADDFQYGALLDAIGEARGQITEKQIVALLGDDA